MGFFLQKKKKWTLNGLRFWMKTEISTNVGWLPKIQLKVIFHGGLSCIAMVDARSKKVEIFLYGYRSDIPSGCQGTENKYVDYVELEKTKVLSMVPNGADLVLKW
ncbi:hypothetical protein Ccrd_005759 [Cynara cardunculus var. scolymus]|uniref:Uncharacterized protein n=1 Tax=Cynara cardunculus var. scolymus TaxID=59895 RepID=A0A103XK49_CYNCS|nr:hypothetical protein Ccrd_005759 [Cynara cardunculus var. scolymus]